MINRLKGQNSFQSTPSPQKVTRTSRRGLIDNQISIHSPRKQRDLVSLQNNLLLFYFNPLSAQAERHYDNKCQYNICIFQSTLRASRETFRNHDKGKAFVISIHSPRKQRDRYVRNRYAGMSISIHSPRKQRDLHSWWSCSIGFQFQSTLRASRETWYWFDGAGYSAISIHSPRKQRDKSGGSLFGECYLFQSTLRASRETSG